MPATTTMHGTPGRAHGALLQQGSSPAGGSFDGGWRSLDHLSLEAWATLDPESADAAHGIPPQSERRFLMPIDHLSTAGPGPSKQPDTRPRLAAPPDLRTTDLRRRAFCSIRGLSSASRPPLATCIRYSDTHRSSAIRFAPTIALAPTLALSPHPVLHEHTARGATRPVFRPFPAAAPGIFMQPTTMPMRPLIASRRKCKKNACTYSWTRVTCAPFVAESRQLPNEIPSMKSFLHIAKPMPSREHRDAGACALRVLRARTAGAAPVD